MMRHRNKGSKKGQPQIGAPFYSFLAFKKKLTRYDILDNAHKDIIAGTIIPMGFVKLKSTNTPQIYQ